MQRTEVSPAPLHTLLHRASAGRGSLRFCCSHGVGLSRARTEPTSQWLGGTIGVLSRMIAEQTRLQGLAANPKPGRSPLGQHSGGRSLKGDLCIDLCFGGSGGRSELGGKGCSLRICGQENWVGGWGHRMARARRAKSLTSETSRAGRCHHSVVR